MNQVNEQWKNVLDILKRRYSTPSFETWFKNTKAKSEKNKWYITAPNEFARDWLESRYLSDIKEAICTVTEKSPDVVVITNENSVEVNQPELKIEKVLRQIESLTLNEREILFSCLYRKLHSNREDTDLNRNLTFDHFSISSSNRFSYIAAQSVAKAPGKAYNPLFIHGAVGLGKTHLLHAISNEILDNNPTVKVIYVSAEQFTNEFIGSIRNNDLNGFRSKYRKVDVLLFDDVQFLVDKVQVQDEFFHIFNQLYEKSKQIVITSNCPPKEIPALKERLLARFEWGLITEIQSYKVIDDKEDDIKPRFYDEMKYTQIKDMQDLDRIILLENEFKQMKIQLNKLQTQVEVTICNDKD